MSVLEVVKENLEIVEGTMEFLEEDNIMLGDKIEDEVELARPTEGGAEKEGRSREPPPGRSEKPEQKLYTQGPTLIGNVRGVRRPLHTCTIPDQASKVVEELCKSLERDIQ